jgi:hypothetical protein
MNDGIGAFAKFGLVLSDPHQPYLTTGHQT